MEGDVARLTDEAFWDEYWQGTELPQEFTEADLTRPVRELLSGFERHFPTGRGLTMLEIGGAPGRYAAYFHRRFGYAVSTLDSSGVGSELARRNFELLGIPATAMYGDMFDATLDLPRYDIVYSLGLIEHFDNPASVIAAHLRFVKPGGLLAIGAPNMRGINRALHRWLSPSVIDGVHPPSTDPRRWAEFERRFGLELVAKDYVAGFEPRAFWRQERRWNPLAWALWGLLRALTRVWDRAAFRRIRGARSWRWSGYIIGVYRAPEGETATG